MKEQLTEERIELMLKEAASAFPPPDGLKEAVWTEVMEAAVAQRTSEGPRRAPEASEDSLETGPHRCLFGPLPWLVRLPRRVLEGVRAMRPAYRLVAVAVIVVVMVGLATWLLPGDRGPGLAFAEVLDRVRSVRTVKFTSTVTMEGGPGGVSEILRLEPGRSRTIDTRTGRVTIVDKVAGRTLLLNPDAKKAILIIYEGPAEAVGELPATLLEKITELRDGTEQELGQRVMDGRTVSGFRSYLGGREWVVWADSQTGLPVRVETTHPLMAPGLRMVMTDFEWGLALDESLFSLTPPEGYLVEEKRVAASPPVREADLIEGLKFWSERMDSTFPAAFVGLLMTKALNEGLGAEFRRQYDEEVLKEGASGDLEKLRDIGEEVRERVYGQAHKKVMRMVEFAGEQDEWRYVGRGVRLGEAGKPVCWWRPEDSKTYRVVYGDLNVRGITPEALPPVPEAKEPFEWLPTEDDVDMASCRRNLKQIGIALFMYTKANDYKYPEALDELVTFLEGRGPLACPASEGGEAEYIYAKPADRLTEVERPADVMLVFDRYKNHTFGRNVLFADGGVAWLGEEDFEQRWAEQQRAFKLAGLSELGDEAALRRVCQGRLRALGNQLFMYLRAHDNRYPDTFDAVIASSDMFLSNQLLTCPAVGDGGVDYIYVKPAERQLPPARLSETMVMFDKLGNHPGGRNVLFATSEVKWLTEEEFQRLWAEQQAHAAPEE